MKEIPFSIPVSGVVRIDEEQAIIIVNEAKTIISLRPEALSGKGTPLEPGKTMYDVILETAREVVQSKGFNRFTAPELYRKALEKYPGLNRGSFMARVIASTPDHPSYKHYKSGRDYLSRIGEGLYRLNERYMPVKTPDKGIVQNQRKLSTEG